MWDIFCRQLLRHEAHLDKRLHTIGQQAIVNLVDVREVIDGPPLAVFVVDADFIVKNGMKSRILEVCDLLYFTQVAAIAVAQAEDGASGTEYLLPEVGKGMRWGSPVDQDHIRVSTDLGVRSAA